MFVFNKKIIMITYFFLVSSIVNVFSASSYQLLTQWTHFIHPTDIVGDNFGNIYTASVSNEKMITLKKFSSRGDEELNIILNGNDLSCSIAVDNNENIYISGNFSDFISKTDNAQKQVTILEASADRGMELYIIKFDQLGELLWAHRAGGFFDNYGCSIVVNSNNLFFSGSFYKNIMFDSGAIYNLSNSSSNDALFLAKFNFDGEYIDIRIIEGPGQINSLTVDRSGKMYMTGEHYSNLIFLNGVETINLFGNQGMFLAALDSNGFVKWVTKTDGGECIGKDVTVDQTGNILVTGTNKFETSFYNGSEVFKTLIGSRSDIFVAKYDASGKLLWVNQIGSSGYDYSFSIATIDDNHILITGYLGEAGSFNIGSLTPISVESQCQFIVDYDADGNILSLFNHNKTSTNDIHVDRCGNIIVSGWGNGLSKMLYLRPDNRLNNLIRSLRMLANYEEDCYNFLPLQKNSQIGLPEIISLFENN